MTEIIILKIVAATVLIGMIIGIVYQFRSKEYYSVIDKIVIGAGLGGLTGMGVLIVAGLIAILFI